MRHKGVFALVAAGIGAAAVLVAAPAGAQEEEPEELPLSVEPLTGGAGTVITVSGEGCASENPEDAPEVDFILADEEFFFGEGEGVVADEDLVQAEDDGTWSGQLTVPADVDPDLSWFVSALCFSGPGEDAEVLAVYEIVEFDVTGPPTTTPTTPSTTPPPTTPPAAPPAVPVTEEPDFTG
jgi:hypothetical protein